MKRAVTAGLVVAGLAMGCSSNDKSLPTASTKPPSAQPSSCSATAAKAARQVSITASKFDTNCVSVKLKGQFFIINNDATPHTIVAVSPSPEPFNVTLPKKASTYARSFTVKGEHTVTIKGSREVLTIFVS